ncbi:unnamed protein product [Rodentolepis nana]|uniref:SCP domain-containing protein n=1 Tax=Rodentolepis nana TaxID=102285 RepID=A0A0R3TZC8_RODNA|nr:unnamed protein product [Rodentolepis nana]
MKLCFLIFGILLFSVLVTSEYCFSTTIDDSCENYGCQEYPCDEEDNSYDKYDYFGEEETEVSNERNEEGFEIEEKEDADNDHHKCKRKDENNDGEKETVRVDTGAEAENKVSGGDGGLRGSGEERTLEVQMLKLHNEFRRRASEGTVPGQPIAKGLQDLVWNETLAKLAMNNSRDCKFGALYSTEKLGHGQNIGHARTVEEIFHDWINEGKFYDYQSNTCTDYFLKCRNYKQVIKKYFKGNALYREEIMFGMWSIKAMKETTSRKIFRTMKFYCIFLGIFLYSILVNAKYHFKNGDERRSEKIRDIEEREDIGKGFEEDIEVGLRERRWNGVGDSVDLMGNGGEQTLEVKMLQLHNEFRRNASKGRVPYQPGAIGLQNLVWSEGLANMAKESSKKCQLKPTSGWKIDGIGQNIANSRTIEEWVAFKQWTNESKNYFYQTNYCEGKCRSYKQVSFILKIFIDLQMYSFHFKLVSSLTKYVGCGVTKCSNYGYVLVCNYGIR